MAGSAARIGREQKIVVSGMNERREYVELTYGQDGLKVVYNGGDLSRLLALLEIAKASIMDELKEDMLDGLA
jgi:hypothetical protein